MLTENQKQIVTEFFRYSQSYGSVSGMWIKKEIPNLGKVVSMTKTGDTGLVTIKGKKNIRITTIEEPGLTPLIAFMQEIVELRKSLEKICEENIPKREKFPKFVILFDNDTPQGTRFIFYNYFGEDKDKNYEYETQYKIVKKKLKEFGYKVSLDCGCFVNFYITKYKKEYLQKNFFEKFIYNIIY